MLQRIVVKVCLHGITLVLVSRKQCLYFLINLCVFLKITSLCQFFGFYEQTCRQPFYFTIERESEFYIVRSVNFLAVFPDFRLDCQHITYVFKSKQ